MFLLNYIKGINDTNKKLRSQTNSSRMHFHVLEIINFSLVRADTRLILWLHLLFCIPYYLTKITTVETLLLSIYFISSKKQINLFVACCYLKLHWHSKKGFVEYKKEWKHSYLHFSIFPLHLIYISQNRLSCN